MGGKCESDKGQSVGCKLIQKMSSDIRKIKELRHPFSGWSILIIAVLVVIIAGFLLASTFKSNSYPTEIRLDVRVDGGGAVSEKAKANIKLELSEALLAMEARAAAAYNEKFATLLTILTIFGIAWPVIIALLQFKFSEKELKKIENAQEKAEESLKQSSVAREKAEESLSQSSVARKKTEESLSQSSVAREKAEGSLKQANEAREKAEESLKQSSEARGNAQKCLDEIAETNMRIYRCNGDVYYQQATSETGKYSDLKAIASNTKVDILHKFIFSIDSYIRATLAVKDDNACRRTVYTKINNMCDWINKIIPNLKSQFLVHEFDFLLSFFDDIPDSESEKIKIMDRLRQIRNDLAEDCPEPEI